AIKPLKINQHDEPVSPLSHEAISPKYPDDGQFNVFYRRLFWSSGVRN
ncbi:hypothetical protein IWQ55_005020, partial [Labrenzia sp. EL_208]|nr:hypothetical protein [Labrenzia sp. EL_208]